MRDAVNEPVDLADPDPAWREIYADEARRIAGGLVQVRPVIEHIGSTAVPLRAKPIVDIQIVVAERDVGSAVSALRRLGYEHLGQADVPGREYLRRRPRHGPSINAHVFGS